jgi:hypothetical protein
MAHYTGKNLFIRWIYGTAEYILTGTDTPQADFRTIGWDESLDKAEISAGSDTARDYLPTLADVTFDFTFIDDGTAGSAIYRAFAVGNHGTIQIGPLGSAAGLPIYSCWAFVDSSPREFQYDAEVERSYTLQRRGNWISHYDQSGSTF